jgi:aminoglycoside phosphotransferase (APT) family kinase protein
VEAPAAPAVLCQNGRVSSLEERVARYAAQRMPEAEDLAVADLERIHGGASRETYRFRLRWRSGGEACERRLILRRDPPGSLIETERAIEFNAYRAFHGTGVPVPEPLWLEEDPRWLDHPFFVMEEVPDLEARPQVLFAPPYDAHLEKLGQRKWEILGEISRADPDELGLVGVMKPIALDAAWRRELDYWEGVLDEDELCPQPIIRAAIRWLRRHPPPPAQRLSVVHGDYRTGNFLFDTEGRIHAILDWEMAHLGDPLEDLAWGINRVWCWAKDERVGGLLPKARAVRIWEESSGLRADPDALHWWELFSCVKGQGIWVSGAHEYQAGVNQDPVLALSGWMQMNAQDRAALELMGHLP